MNGTEKKYDAVIVGAGPNGLSAAIVLAKVGLAISGCAKKQAYHWERNSFGGIDTAGSAKPL